MDPNKLSKDVNVKIIQKFEEAGIDIRPLERLTKNICKRFGIFDVSINILIVNSPEIQKVNKKFLNKKYTTDVISFDLSDENTDNKAFDIMVNAQKAKAQAKLRGHSCQGELALYITHGLLHNLGFDDSTEKLAKQMHKTEDEILQQSGFGKIYDS